MSMKDLANQPRHAGKRASIDGKDLVLSLHAGAAGLGERLHQKAGTVGKIQRRPGAVAIEEAVKDRSSAGYVKERRTSNQ